MDNYYGYALGKTKIIKSKSLPDLELEDVYDKSTRFTVGTKIFKVVNYV